MKTNLKTIAALSLGAALTISAPLAVLAHGKDKHVQNVTINVSSSGYSPTTVTLKAGRPVHMTFVSKGGGCANEIVIPALKKTISLKPGQKKMLDFTPKKGQTIAFSCSMKMFKGKVDIEAEPDIAARYGLQTPPMIAFLKPDGTLSSRFEGYADAPTLLKQMTAAYAKARRK